VKYAYLIFTIPMVLSIMTGFVSISILVPRWLVHRRSLTKRSRMAAGFAFVGRLIPLAFLAEYAVTQTEIVSSSPWVWPASLGLAALDPPGSASAVSGNCDLRPHPLEQYRAFGLAGAVGWFGLEQRERNLTGVTGGA
jgi:hypothetical protein